MFGVNKFWVRCSVRCEKDVNSLVRSVTNYRVPMSKRKPTSSQPGIDRYFCKSLRLESPVDEGEKKVADGDRQTPAIPTTSNSAARVDGLFFFLCFDWP